MLSKKGSWEKRTTYFAKFDPFKVFKSSTVFVNSVKLLSKKHGGIKRTTNFLIFDPFKVFEK
jgi:hypothetical protein